MNIQVLWSEIRELDRRISNAGKEKDDLIAELHKKVEMYNTELQKAKKEHENE